MLKDEQPNDAVKEHRKIVTYIYQYTSSSIHSQQLRCFISH